MPQISYTTAAVASAGVLGGAYAAYHLYNEYKKPKLPQEWTHVGSLKNIYAYPIKSCAPVILSTIECDVLGLKNNWLRDRVLMVVDEKNNFVTARAHPELLTVFPTVNSSILTVKHQDMEPLAVNLAEVAAFQPQKKATVWSVEVPVYDCGSEAAEWFSRLLDKSTSNFRLVYYASQSSRGTTVTNIHKIKQKDTGALPDQTSFNLINDASVEELNSRVKDCDVTHRNFRPNFVLDGAKPYDEDKWKFVKIGENIFEVVKPCTRCILTTIDPETGVKHIKAEPLETLKSYRQIEDPVLRKINGNSPRMGLQMALRSQSGGILSLNDPIYAAY